MPLASDVDLAAIAASAERFTGKHTCGMPSILCMLAPACFFTQLASLAAGAELAAVCREAAMSALREDLQGGEGFCVRLKQSVQRMRMQAVLMCCL